MGLNELTITQLKDAFHKKTAKPSEALNDVINAIETDNTLKEPVGAYLELFKESALAQAKRMDERAAKGETLPLLGVPIAIKDNIAYEGHAMQCASKILDGYVSPYSSFVTKKILDAGAIIVGRTNMDEFAMGSSTENSAFFTTRNPKGRDRIPGGSSGGSAAAVSAHHASASLGSDTGGSIRQPAAFTGVVGLKPTYGLVSRNGLTAFGSSLDQIGPLTKSVTDAALMLSIIAGKDENDSTSIAIPSTDYTKALTGDIKGMRLGLPKEYFVKGLNDEVKTRIIEVTKAYEKLGAVITEISLPHTEYGVAVYYVIATAEASSNLARFDGVRYGRRAKDAKQLSDVYNRSRTEGFGDEVKRRILLGTYVLSSGYYDAYYMKALKVRTLIKQDFDNAFKQVDAIITPTTPTTAFKAGEKTANPIEMYLSDIYTITVNLAGVPGISVPCGTDIAGLPIGFQLIGKHFDEAAILRLAHAYETR